jgi:hypothetical protein
VRGIAPVQLASLNPFENQWRKFRRQTAPVYRICGKRRVCKSGGKMNSLVNKNVNVEVATVEVKKAWKKPVLDILELQNAQHGAFTITDGITKHHS